MQKETKALYLKIMHHLSTAFQKSMVYKSTMHKVSICSCQCSICLNTAKVTEKQQVVFGIITETNQAILLLLILNFSNPRQVLHEILRILLLMLLIMDATKVGKN